MKAQNHWSHTVLLALSTAIFSSDAAAERIAATYCVTIGVTLEGTSALVKRLDDFALDTGLTFETNDPGGRYYFPEDESAMIALRNGMGEFGSVLSYVPLGSATVTG
ncbi:MAG: hypothetical protein Kow00114_01080 [Kiloniellaceae bacterium]